MKISKLKLQMLVLRICASDKINRCFPNYFFPMNYEEILKCYEGITEEHASTSFEFGIQNELYYRLFYSYTESQESV